MNGVRSSKTVNGVKHNYITQDGKVIREEYGTTVLEFVYDTNGAPYALRYRSNGGSWQTYYYVLNLQGDVVALLNETGSVCARYTYNAWGEILSATNPSSSTVNIQDINPLRYRGYYYDTETGWYYLRSRYYDPVVKRFINADGYASTGQGILGHNMLAYCNNNPVSFSDDGGTRPAYSTMETDTGGGGRVYVSSKGVTDSRPETKEFYAQNKEYIEEDIEKNVAECGSKNYAYEVRYKGKREVTDDTRRAEQIEAALSGLFTKLVTTVFLRHCGCLWATTDRVSSALGLASGFLEYRSPKNTLANGVYEQYTLFIDIPCVMYGESCTKTVVMDYYWAYIDGSPEAVLIRVG